MLAQKPFTYHRKNPISYRWRKRDPTGQNSAKFDLLWITWILYHHLPAGVVQQHILGQYDRSKDRFIFLKDF
jgi:hypothetical protein